MKFGKDEVARAKARAAQSASGASAVGQLPMKSSNFRGSGRRLLVDALSKPEGSRPEQQAALEQLYTSGFTEFEKVARRNNVAYALAFALGVSLVVDRGVEISDESSEELAAGINDVLGATPAFKKLRPAQRQAMYEAAIASGRLVAALAELGKEDPEMALLSKALAPQILGQLGL
jgi:hypothetical protein